MIRLTNVRLSYPDIKPRDEIDLIRRREPSFRVDIMMRPYKMAQMAQAYGRSVVPFLFAYDAQKLLPSPEKMPPLGVRQTAQLWSANFFDEAYKMGLEWRSVFADNVFPKAATPERFYFEGGHFDMQPKGTVNMAEEYIDFGTPTGRHRRLAPFVTPYTVPRWSEADANPLEDLKRWRRQVLEETTPIQHKVAVLRVENIDYAVVEERILSFYGDKRVRGIILDLDSPSGEINPQMDLYRMAAMMQKPVAAPEEKRNTGYLKHDPSKQHKRRKRK